MYRLWVMCRGCGGRGRVDGPEPAAPGKARLYVGVDSAKATLSANQEKKFSPALEVLQASGGVMVETKGVLLIDVPQADKAKATRNR